MGIIHVVMIERNGEIVIFEQVVLEMKDAQHECTQKQQSYNIEAGQDACLRN